MELDFTLIAAFILLYIAAVRASPQPVLHHSSSQSTSRLLRQHHELSSHSANAKSVGKSFPLLRRAHKHRMTPVSHLSRNGLDKRRREDSFLWIEKSVEGFMSRSAPHFDLSALTRDVRLTTSQRQGLNFERCNSDSDCAESRNCVVLIDDDFVSCPDNEDCLCLHENGAGCTSTSDCDRGELCVVSTERESRAGLCVSSAVIEAIGGYEEAGTGLNYVDCSSNDECKGDRLCVIDSETLCTSGASCQCFPIFDPDCVTQSDCELGEICTTPSGFNSSLCVSVLSDGPLFLESSSSPSPVSSPSNSPLPTDGNSPEPSSENSSPSAPSSSPSPISEPLGSPSPLPNPTASPSSVLVSPSPSPTPSPGGAQGGICIDAKALKSFSRHQLVFREHSHATVLCDRNESCATPGHMVQYRGAPMMMKTYCAMVGCTRRVMEVNSPRYRWGLRVESRTEELEYTAFAARYETRGEEAAMQIALRMSL